MNTTQQQDVHGNDRGFLVAIIVVALVLRLIRIGFQSLWVDEMLTLAVSTPTGELNIWDYLKFNIHGPLHSFVVYLLHFVSMNDGWLRFPSALAGVGAVVYLYYWIRAWLGRDAARICALILAIHPIHVYYSQELRNYSFLLFFVLMACYRLHMLLHDSRRRHWVWYAIAVACAGLSNFSAAFVFAVHTIIFFKKKRIGWVPLKQWALVSVVILVLMSPWIYRVSILIDFTRLVTPVTPGQISTTERLRGETTFSRSAVPYMFYSMSAGFSLGPSTRELHTGTNISKLIAKYPMEIFGVAVIFGATFVWGVWLAFRRKLPWFELGLYFLLPVLCMFALNWQNAKPFNVRYVLVSLPAFICFLAIGITGTRGVLRWVMSGLVVAVMLVSLGNYYFNGRFARDDVKGAARHLAKRLEAGECILAPTVTEIVSHYYGGDAPVYRVFRRHRVSADKVNAQLHTFFAACNSFWYVRARPWVDDPDGFIMQSIAARYDQLEVIHFNGVALFHFAQKKEE